MYVCNVCIHIYIYTYVSLSLSLVILVQWVQSDATAPESVGQTLHRQVARSTSQEAGNWYKVVNNSVCTAALSVPSSFPQEYGKRGGFNLHQSSSSRSGVLPDPAKLFDFMYQCLAKCPTPDLKEAFPNERPIHRCFCADQLIGTWATSFQRAPFSSATGEPRWVYVQGTWSSIILLDLFGLVSELCPFWPKVNRCAGLVYLVSFSWRCCLRQDSWTLLKPLLDRTGLEELSSQRLFKQPLHLRADASPRTQILLKAAGLGSPKSDCK